MQPHRRQYVIGPRAWAPYDSWRTVPLSGGLVLSHCPTLPVETTTDADGQAWVLLGIALQADPTLGTPINEIRHSPTGDVVRLADTWSGRWTLIGMGTLYMDACGLMSCLYGTDQYGDMWASSSPALLASILQTRVVAPRLLHGQRMDWHPAPLTRLAGVRRLMSSQVLNLHDRTTIHRPLLAPVAPDGYDAILRRARDLLTTATSAAAEIGPIRVALSGGYDSRLVLATAVAAGVPVECYTWQKPWPDMSRGDRILPPRLAAAVGVRHHALRGRLDPRRRFSLFDEHTAGHCVDIDRMYITRGYWDLLPPDAVALRGAIYPITRATYNMSLPAGLPEDRFGAADAIMSIFSVTHPTHREALQEWAAWMVEHREPIDWRDRLHWEQRSGAWASGVEQALDLVPTESLTLANCREFLSILLSLPQDVRERSEHFIDLTRMMAPPLAGFPWNPPNPMPHRAAHKAKRIVRRVFHRLTRS